MEGMWGNFMRNNQNTLKSLFQRKRLRSNDGESPENSPKPIPQLSSTANSVVSRCSNILKIPTEDLQHRFDMEQAESVKQLFTYARNFLEFCSYQALNKVSKNPDYLGDQEFRRLTFDIMLAWEAPSIECEARVNDTSSGIEKLDDEEGESLFYLSSMNMAVQVDDKKTVGREAFARIAPICTVVADVITVQNLFDALTSSSGHQLHFLVYDKYLRNLDKVIRAAKNTLGHSLSHLPVSEVEIILDVEGAVPTQPVLQHLGMAAWPGRLTLTNFALYFESLGVGIYDKGVRYDLAMDLKQVIKPELTGPLGARLFDKAVMYKSMIITEPVYFEFPEFKGHSRRDYWLDIILEILYAHKFIRKHKFKETQQSEVLARAILGIFRYRAMKEAFHFNASPYKTLLCFNLAESLPGGDVILETLSSRLELLIDDTSSQIVKQMPTSYPVSLLALSQLGFILQKEVNLYREATIIGDFFVGEIDPLELAVKRSISNTARAEAAQATVDQVKVEGIDTNFAVMKELLFPVIELANRLQLLVSWKDPFRSAVFLMLCCFAIIRGWIRYIVASVFVFFAIIMLWRKHFNKGKNLEAYRITAPPNRNAVEQILTLQEAISQAEALIQTGNIILLKIRALLFAVLPQATDRVALLLGFMAIVLAFLPFKYLTLCVFLEAFTREMPYRRDSSDKWVRRLREWWFRIPAAPVHVIKIDDKKKK